jgi:hypothetical protein
VASSRVIARSGATKQSRAGAGSIIGGMVFLTPLAAFALLMASHMWTVGITRIAFILFGTTALSVFSS